MDKTELTIIKHIADNPTRLRDVDDDKLKEVAEGYKFDELKGEMKQRVGLYRIRYKDEREKFLSKQSHYTMVNYAYALDTMEMYTNKMGVMDSPLELDHRTADDFILSIIPTCSPNRCRLIVAGCSSFFTFMERRFDVVKNPFRGTTCRPKKRGVRKLELPSESDVETVIQSSTGALRVGLVIIKELGLRVGALPGLSIRNGRWKTVSKGKEINGEVNERIMKEVKVCGLNLNHPFHGYSDWKVKNDISYQIRKCYKDGSISTNFSPHDVRHLLAVREYERTKDIIKVRDMLKHASISITETYLRGLGLV